MGVVEEAVEHRGDRGVVADHLAPVFDRTIRGEDRARAFVAAHHELEEILRSGVGQLAHAEIIDDEERDGGEFGDALGARAVDRCFGELLEQDVRLAVALLDRSVSDRLRDVTLARPGRSEEECVFVLRDEASGRELEDDAAIHLLVEIEIEGVEGLRRVAKSGLLDASLDESIAASQEFVGDERGDEVDWRERFGLRLQQPRFEDARHAAEAELEQGVIQFDEIHSDSFVMFAMRSR